MGRAIRATIEPIAASAGTVIAGLLCLTLSDLASNKSLGPVAAIGIASAFLAALTFLPALLLVPARGRAGSSGRTGPPTTRPAPTPTPTDRPTDRGAAAGSGAGWRGAVGRRPRAVWVTTALVLAAGAAFLPTFQASGTDEADVFLTEVDAVEGAGRAVRALPGRLRAAGHRRRRPRTTSTR